jgi:hypothetical protein
MRARSLASRLGAPRLLGRWWRLNGDAATDKPEGGHMNGALIVTWGSNIPGREAKGLEVFGKALAYFDELAKKGRIHGHKEYITLTGNADQLAGLMLVEGPVEELVKLQTEEATRALLIEGASITKNFTATVAAGGDEQTLTQEIGLFTKTQQGLGYM